MEVSSGIVHQSSAVNAYQAVTAAAGHQISTEGYVSSERLTGAEQGRPKLLPVDAATADAITVDQQSMSFSEQLNGCDGQQHVLKQLNKDSGRLSAGSSSGQDSFCLQTGSDASRVSTHASQAQLSDAQPTVAASISKGQATAGSRSSRSRKGLIKTLARTTPTRAPSVLLPPVPVAPSIQDINSQVVDPCAAQQPIQTAPMLPLTQCGHPLQPANCNNKQHAQHALDLSSDSMVKSSRIISSHQAELAMQSPASSHKSLMQGSQQAVHVARLAGNAASSLNSLKRGSSQAVHGVSPVTASKTASTAVRRSLLHHPHFH